MIHGMPGVGKTTFGANCPSPLFFATEDGQGAVEGKKLPIHSMRDIYDACAALLEDKRDFHTVVLDSADWLGTLMQDELMKAAGKRSMNQHLWGEFGGSAKRVASMLMALRDKARMAVVIVAHTKLKHIEDPTKEPYDSWDVALQGALKPALTQICDQIGFASIVTDYKTQDGARIAQGSKRIISFAETEAYLSKNRYGLPEKIPLDAKTFFQHWAKKTKGE